jgi:murein DD-endopeptidase MepM/ murein hydrolase activator NlpD
MRGVSIVVKAGQKIRRGQRLGRVGLSGSTEFPHGHFSVLKNRKFLDPATGQPLGAGCDASGTSLWRAPGRLAYQPMALYAVGFSARAIKGTTVKWDASSL